MLNYCTGHDIAEDMLAAGLASVTMVQRSPTCTGFLISVGQRTTLAK
jgi:cation diffusion facilitator CzcD-associated flavoprotein CzcO